MVDPCFASQEARATLIDLDTGRRHVIDLGGASYRIEIGAESITYPAVVLPLDRLFDVRVQFADRLCRALAGRSVGPNPSRLSATRRNRLVQSLRALDGHIAHASYRDIAAALFGDRAIPNRGWKTHDLRDRTIRLVRYGTHLMEGGYRALLLHPYRGRLPASHE